jgi:hypothetical protein
VVITLGFLAAKELLPGALHLIVGSGHALGIDRASMSNNLLSAAVWALLAVVVAAVVARLRDRR